MGASGLECLVTAVVASATKSCACIAGASTITTALQIPTKSRLRQTSPCKVFSMSTGSPSTVIVKRCTESLATLVYFCLIISNYQATLKAAMA